MGALCSSWRIFRQICFFYGHVFDFGKGFLKLFRNQQNEPAQLNSGWRDRNSALESKGVLSAISTCSSSSGVSCSVSTKWSKRLALVTKSSYSVLGMLIVVVMLLCYPLLSSIINISLPRSSRRDCLGNPIGLLFMLA